MHRTAALCVLMCCTFAIGSPALAAEPAPTAEEAPIGSTPWKFIHQLVLRLLAPTAGDHPASNKAGAMVDPGGVSTPEAAAIVTSSEGPSLPSAVPSDD